VEIIKRNVQLQARLIDDLLDLTRIARGMLHLELEECDAHKIIENALEMANSALAAKQFKLSTELKAKRYHILADCIRLQQVFWNLINNAVKFTAPGGQITIRTFNDKDGRFHFEIEDTGIGIEPQRLASLFQPFEQADPSVSRQFGGLGLGLAISKRLIDLHHGRIEAESRGRSFGATFKVTLDAQPDGTAADGVNHRLGGKTSKPLRILLVEDHNDTRRTMSRLLIHFGHDVVTADNVEGAMARLASNNIDAVLCDIGLPDGSGYEVAAQARANGGIKTVALTGFGTEQDVQRSKEAGFDFHLVKPINFQELQKILDQSGA
jgi:CheY-like chemotaxis protein/anti-sigma regulatory factor (Ser/Thr protein kinase)